MKLERIFACGCAVVGVLFLIEQLRIVAGWPIFVALVISPLVAGGLFERLGSWRNRDAFLGSLMAFALIDVQAIIVTSSRGDYIGKLVLGSIVLTGLAGLVMMLGAWVARRVFLDAPVGAPTLLAISTLVTSFLVDFGSVVVHELITSSSIALAVFESGFALIAGITTQRIAPSRHIVACGAGATVVVAWGFVARLVRGSPIDFDFSTLSYGLLIVAGFAGAAIGEKLRPEQRPSYAEFD